MQRRLYIAALLLSAILLGLNAQNINEWTNERQRQRIEQFLEEHKDWTGLPRPDLWAKGIEETHRMKVAAGIPGKAKGGIASAPSSPGGITGVQWTQIGPAPLRIDAQQVFQGSGPDSGEVVDVAIDPRNATDQVIYIATNDGGIWKTTDGGTSWKPKTDFMPSLSMGAVALDPTNPSIVYAGTGNAFDGGGFFFKGVGIYKSIDSGETWAQLNRQLNSRGLFDGIAINRIAVLQSGVLLAATSGGVFRSIDGGLNFGSDSPNFSNGLAVLGGNATDLDVDTATPTTIYASVSGVGLFRSTDSGVTFTNLFTSSNGGPTSNLGLIAFAQSTRPDNQTMYATVAAGSGGYLGLFGSQDAGANWTLLPDAANRAAENNGCQCGYDLTVGVDPQDATRVYIGFQELYLSTDSGANFGTPAVTRNQVHWDHHALIFSPPLHWGATPTRFYVGTDGGIATSGDGGASFTNLNEGIATNLFKHIDIGRGSTSNNAYTYGGTQDTGTIERRPGFTGNDWHLGIDGDGSGVAVNPGNPQITWGVDNGVPIRTTDGGDNWQFGGIPGLATAWRYAIDPNNGNNIFASSSTNVGFSPGNMLFRSTTAAPNFSLVNAFPTNIQTIANVQTDSNVLWVGLTNGTAQRTANALASTVTWTPISITGAPNQAISGIAINPLNTSEVVVVYQGFCGGLCPERNRTRHVFRTTDNGTTWTDISGTDDNPSGNLPDMPLHSVVIDPSTTPVTIVVSGDSGVLRSANLGATWEVLGVGLPTVDSVALALDYNANPSLLRIGTYGRSVFELTAATGPLIGVNTNLVFGDICKNQPATRTVQIFNVGSTDLHISSFVRLSGSIEFTILSGPTTPVTVKAGEEIDYTIQFLPTSTGEKSAVFQINSDDPNHPSLQLPASGAGRRDEDDNDQYQRFNYSNGQPRGRCAADAFQ